MDTNPGENLPEARTVDTEQVDAAVRVDPYIPAYYAASMAVLLALTAYVEAQAGNPAVADGLSYAGIASAAGGVLMTLIGRTLDDR